MFPDFNFYSTPLLILALQGLIFAFLLLLKYRNNKVISNLFLALILLFSCYGQICYTIGFMGWYDTYRTTKINYFLFNTGIVIAPLIYLYVKSVTTSNFKFKSDYWWHFVLALIILLFRICIFFYDSWQPGFEDTQNGLLKIQLDEPYFQPISAFIIFPYMLLYLAFTLQLFYNYRKRIIQYFSNTYQLELNWMFSFLLLFSLLFIYDSIQSFVGSFFTDLNYQERWWLNFFTALVTLYVGIKGYFTDTTKLNKLDFRFSPAMEAIPQEPSEEPFETVDEELKARVISLMQMDKVFLKPDLNLSEMAKMANMTRAQLSETINNGFNQNFNDFVNAYRVQAFKDMIHQNRHEHLSLLGIAQDCGFNSKATFNRVFKKLTDRSPSEYLRQIGD